MVRLIYVVVAKLSKRFQSYVFEVFISSLFPFVFRRIERKREVGGWVGDLLAAGLAGALTLLADERLVNVGDDTTSGNGCLDQGVQLLVTSDSQLQVAGGDTLHLQVLGCVTGQLENLEIINKNIVIKYFGNNLTYYKVYLSHNVIFSCFDTRRKISAPN